MKKKLIITLFLFIFTVNLSAATEYSSVDNIAADQQTKLEAPLQNLFSSTGISIFFQEFEMKLRMEACGSGMDLSFGFNAHMIEPIGYMENTKKPLYFPFADMDLGGNILKSCSSRASSVEESTRDECYNQHFIYAPIFGMIFKKKLEFICFHSGTIALPILSEFNPAHLVDVYAYKMIPQMIAMVSPQAIVSTILNCAATSAYSTITGYSTGQIGTAPVETSELNDDATQDFGQNEWAEGYEDPDLRESNYTSTNTLKEKGIEALSFIRNSMFYNVGCLGFTPVGGYVRGQDPGVDNVMLSYSAMAQLHGFGAMGALSLLKKQTEFGMEMAATNGASMGSTMCVAKSFAMPIETQYIFQRAYPTVAGGKEQGESGISTTTMANVPGSKDSFVNVFWERRDYLAFAYECTDDNMSTSE